MAALKKPSDAIISASKGAVTDVYDREVRHVKRRKPKTILIIKLSVPLVIGLPQGNKNLCGEAQQPRHNEEQTATQKASGSQHFPIFNRP